MQSDTRTDNSRPSPIGRRVHVIGNTTSGKSTLAERLARALDADFVELDALNWLPGWVGLNETDPDELERRFQHATRGDAWVVAGSYSAYSQRVFWSRLETVIWLDLPWVRHPGERHALGAHPLRAPDVSVRGRDLRPRRRGKRGPLSRFSHSRIPPRNRTLAG